MLCPYMQIICIRLYANYYSTANNEGRVGILLALQINRAADERRKGKMGYLFFEILSY